MNEEELKKLAESVKKSVDSSIEELLGKKVGVEVAKATRKIVEDMRLERAVFGYDRSGLTQDQKKEFAQAAKSVAFGGAHATKANEEMISEVDSRGGYLLPVEVAGAIQRIARSVGLVLSRAQPWPMSSDELDIPAYTGSILEGEYLGVNAAGSLTAVTFKMAKLMAKKWQLAFALGNDLLQDAPENLADWLLALAGEALANKIDKMGLIGAGNPFTGVMNSADVTAVTLGAGQDTFQEYDVIVDSATVIGNLEESVLEEACFVFSRTVWANLRTQKDDSGQFLLGVGGMSNLSWLLKSDPKSPAGPRPVGNILGHDVFTNRHMPALSASAASTKFGIFGNFSMMGFGRRGQMSMEQFKSGTFGGKEIALADQTGLVIKDKHAVTITLPEAFVTIGTHA